MSSGTTAPAVPLQYDEGHGPEIGVEPLAHGDRRNVVDRYRCWTRQTTVAPVERRMA
ncbi:hypothetical protein [Streptomyces noursei]|uniref:Uncharacterized protein n=1 Tax=Streptomyces yunnanensis TaxID=156453 RepID=A0A9X8N1A0_9ACTN|nr:hypothetical protein SAMN05216268_112202 [Streptomyces yunnanensis]